MDHPIPDPSTGLTVTLRNAIADLPQDRNLINVFGGDCGPRFGTLTPPPSNTSAPPCAKGWLGAATAGIFQPNSSAVNNPYGLSIGTITGYTITVEEFTQGTPGGALTATGTGPGGNIVNYITTTDLSTGGIPSGGLNFNAQSYTGNYFIANYATIRNNFVYKVTYQADISGGTCSTYKAVSYFKILSDGTSSPSGGVTWRMANTVNGTSFDVYPNPTSDKLNFKWKSMEAEGSVTVVITDMLGLVVLKQDYSEVKGANNISLSMSAFAPGVYNYSVNADGGVQRGTFVKK
jgi:hypothetical protein